MGGEVIRSATPADIRACLQMGRAFFDESGFAAELEFDHESMRKTLEHLVSSDDGVLLIAERGTEPIGMAGAIAYPNYFNRMQKAAQELFWWMRPDARGGHDGVRLLRGLERWAQRRLCTTITMICLPELGSPAERVYQRTGYRASERSYIKRL